IVRGKHILLHQPARPVSLAVAARADRKIEPRGFRFGLRLVRGEGRFDRAAILDRHGRTPLLRVISSRSRETLPARRSMPRILYPAVPSKLRLGAAAAGMRPWRRPFIRSKAAPMTSNYPNPSQPPIVSDTSVALAVYILYFVAYV